MIKDAIILLSGGLDSLVSLGLVRNDYGQMLALTFDYGQKSVRDEIESSAKICDYYKIKHKIITLDWLKEITNTALVSENCVPTDIEDFNKSMEAVWVPNRNGLFLNIAGSFADAYHIKILLSVQIVRKDRPFLIILKNSRIVLPQNLRIQHLFAQKLLPR